MLVVRPIQKKDIDQLMALASQAKAGLTTLPNNRDILEKRIEDSLISFKKKAIKPDGELYLFVLEDTQDHKLHGTCGVLSKVGGFQPFYTYKIKTAIKESKKLNVKKKIKYLQLLKVHNGPSEIGTLFLSPNIRLKGTGRLLSLSRFLFIAQYPHRFEKHVIAELRGVLNDEDRSPFWNAVCKHFFDIEFKKADLMVMEDKTFIAELIPEHPLYIPLLPISAQEVIGNVHKDTEPARHLLESEGFQFMNEIDIFEAGPVLGAKVDKIRTIQQSKEVIVEEIIEHIDNNIIYLIANVREFKDFRVTMAPLIINSDGSVNLTRETADAIGIKAKDKIRYVTPK